MQSIEWRVGDGAYFSPSFEKRCSEHALCVSRALLDGTPRMTVDDGNSCQARSPIGEFRNNLNGGCAASIVCSRGLWIEFISEKYIHISNWYTYIFYKSVQLWCPFEWFAKCLLVLFLKCTLKCCPGKQTANGIYLKVQGTSGRIIIPYIFWEQHARECKVNRVLDARLLDLSPGCADGENGGIRSSVHFYHLFDC